MMAPRRASTDWIRGARVVWAGIAEAAMILHFILYAPKRQPTLGKTGSCRAGFGSIEAAVTSHPLFLKFPRSSADIFKWQGFASHGLPIRQSGFRPHCARRVADRNLYRRPRAAH